MYLRVLKGTELDVHQCVVCIVCKYNVRSKGNKYACLYMHDRRCDTAQSKKAFVLLILQGTSDDGNWILFELKFWKNKHMNQQNKINDFSASIFQKNKPLDIGACMSTSFYIEDCAKRKWLQKYISFCMPRPCCTTVLPRFFSLRRRSQVPVLQL
jgi:hypothetical protein